MKLSKIYMLMWVLIGIGISFIDWKWMVVWAVSGFINGLSEYRYKEETKPKKRVPLYVN